MRQLLTLIPLFLFAACGGHHPLDGHWAQATADGSQGMNLEFDTRSDKCLLHMDVDGQHRHGDGTYTFDAATGALTVQMKLPDAAAAVTWEGKLAGGKLELSSPDGKLEFAPGAAAH